MKLLRLAQAGGRVAAAKVLGRAAPLVVSWQLVNRCNLHCRYCDIPTVKARELTTDEVLATLDYLASAGTQRIQFTGGEPLLRRDLPEILARAADLGIHHCVKSNGLLVRKRIEALKRVDVLTLSLDGPQPVHDAIRGEGAFEGVMDALAAAREHGIRVTLTAVLSAQNLDCLDWLLETAESQQVSITFQPATPTRLGSGEDNALTPPVEGYRAAVARLLERKAAGFRWLDNSVTGLRHLATFPDSQRLPCYAGLLSFAVDANGTVSPCQRFSPEGHRPLNLRTDGPEAAFSRVRGGCDQCWCSGLVDFHYAAALHPDAIFDVLRRLQ